MLRLTARIPRSRLTAVPRFSEDQFHPVSVPATTHRPVQPRGCAPAPSPATASAPATVAGLLRMMLRLRRDVACTPAFLSARTSIPPTACSMHTHTHAPTARPPIGILAALPPLDSVRFHLDADHAAPLHSIKDILSRFQCKLVSAATQLGRCFTGSLVSVPACCPPCSDSTLPPATPRMLPCSKLGFPGVYLCICSVLMLCRDSLCC